MFRLNRLFPKAHHPMTTFSLRKALGTLAGTGGARAKVGLGVALSVVLVFGGAAAANAAVLPSAGPTVGGTSVQIPVDRGLTFTQVAVGNFYTVAVGSDGSAHAWGNNAFGQLGNGTTTASSVPVSVLAPAGVTFTQVAAGTASTIAIGSDGNTYTWGNNANGELGNGTTTASSVPVRMQAPAGVTFTQVAASASSMVAVGSDGNTYAWGNNGDGELGNGNTAASSVPVQVQAPAGVTLSHERSGV
jgi:alpha-tubulin suppressor-like RCC1 family protein